MYGNGMALPNNLQSHMGWMKKTLSINLLLGQIGYPIEVENDTCVYALLNCHADELDKSNVGTDALVLCHHIHIVYVL